MNEVPKKLTGFMFQISSNLTPMKVFDIKDTIVCSFMDLEELEFHMEKKPHYDRSKLLASVAVPADIVYYVDEYGMAYKYELESAK